MEIQPWSLSFKINVNFFRVYFLFCFLLQIVMIVFSSHDVILFILHELLKHCGFSLLKILMIGPVFPF